MDANYEHALRSAEPFAELRNLALAELGKGKTHEQVLAAFEDVRSELRDAGRERDEEVVMDAMDCLVGWCAPHATIPAK